MNFDLRFPIGFLFTVFGLILTVFGKFSDQSLYAKSLGLNVNLGWGLVLLVFGVAMLVLALKNKGKT